MACRIHKWDGCRCTKCGKTRDVRHSYEDVPNTCRKRCVKCGTEISQPHTWNGGICEICGVQTPYMIFDSLSERELEVFGGTVIENTMKYISITDALSEKKEERKSFLVRFVKALGIRPLKLVINDADMAIDRLEGQARGVLAKVRTGEALDMKVGTGKALDIYEDYEKNDPEHVAELIECLRSSGIIERQEFFLNDIVILKSLAGNLEETWELTKKLRSEQKRYSTMLLTESDRLAVPCQITITREKMVSSGPKNNTKTTVFLNGNEIGSVLGGETLTASTDLTDNLITCLGNNNPPLYFRAQPGRETRFTVFIPDPGDINSFSLVFNSP